VGVKGQVECKRGNEQWKDVSVGDVFKKGDRIKTYSNSRCDLHMDKQGQQAVGIFDNSEVIVLLDKKEKFELVNATVMFSLEGLPEGSTFEVKTPTAVCGVMGTGFKIFSDTTMTQINAYYNSVYGKNFDGKMKDVPPGYYRTIDKSGKISKLFKCSNMDQKRFRSWKKLSGSQQDGGTQNKGQKKDKRPRNFRFEKPGLGAVDGTRGKMDKKNVQKKDKTLLDTSSSCGDDQDQDIEYRLEQ